MGSLADFGCKTNLPEIYSSFLHYWCPHTRSHCFFIGKANQIGVLGQSKRHNSETETYITKDNPSFLQFICTCLKMKIELPGGIKLRFYDNFGPQFHSQLGHLVSTTNCYLSLHSNVQICAQFTRALCSLLNVGIVFRNCPWNEWDGCKTRLTSVVWIFWVIKCITYIFQNVHEKIYNICKC